MILDLVRAAVLALAVLVVADGLAHPNRKMPPAPVAFEKALTR